MLRPSHYLINIAVKRNKLNEEIKPRDPSICCMKETHFKYIHKVKAEEKIFHAMKIKSEGQSIFLSHKIGIKTKTVTVIV